MTKILFIELLGGLGDVLIALPAIQALAASHPQSEMTVLTFAPGDALLQHHPQIQRVLRAPKGQARQAVLAALQEPYDLVVTDTTYDGIADLVTQSGVRRTITDLWRDPPPDQGVSDRALQILQAESLITAAAARQHRQPRLYLTAAEEAAVRSRLDRLGRPRIGLYADAGMAIKRWAPERFVQLGQMLQDRYGAELVVPVGADPEQSQTIVDQLEGAILWPRGPLRQLAALFAQLDGVVAADTGPARLAAALGIPTVTLFGPAWQGRYGQPPPHINFQGYAACPERNIANFTEQACWYSGTCPFAWDTCVNLISPTQVAAALGESLIQKPDSPKPDHPKPHQTGPGALTVPPATHLPNWSDVRNLLIMRLDNIGDVVMTAPALKALKTNQPDLRLTLLASPAGALAAPLLPWVDQVLPWRTLWQALNPLSAGPEQDWQLVETLKAQNFDGAIILTSFRQSPHPAALIAQLAGIPLRLGASQETGECLTQRVAELPPDLHQVERNLRILEAVGYGVKDRHLSLQIPPSQRVPPGPYLLLNPWASCPARMYSLERFAIAAQTLADKTGWPVVVTGTPEHRDQAASLLSILGDQAIDLVGQTTLADLVALVAQARLMLSNNTATMHIADATQTPSVILFAGTELESQWRPRQTQARLLRRPTPCSPCYAFTCPEQMECLDIPPAEVVAAGLALLQAKPDGVVEFPCSGGVAGKA